MINTLLNLSTFYFIKPTNFDAEIPVFNMALRKFRLSDNFVRQAEGLEKKSRNLLIALNKRNVAILNFGHILRLICLYIFDSSLIQ